MIITQLIVTHEDKAQHTTQLSTYLELIVVASFLRQVSNHLDSVLGISTFALSQKKRSRANKEHKRRNVFTCFTNQMRSASRQPQGTKKNFLDVL